MISWIDNVRELTEQRKWREVISIGECIPFDEKSRILWVWPTEQNIALLKNILIDIKICGILSIGCGSGLLEWILHASTDIPVAGIELGSSWWTSNYCPKPFIKLNFLDSSITSKFLQKCIGRNDWDFALLFCYFNDRLAFLEYVYAFKGHCLVIIGAKEGGNRHTDPSPFNLGNELKNQWHLYNSFEVGNTKDFIAIYVKKTAL